MKTCGECRELDCPGLDDHPEAPACEDFTSKAIEEAPVEWQPTPEEYLVLSSRFDKAVAEINILEERLSCFEQAIAELVKWAQGDETP